MSLKVIMLRRTCDNKRNELTALREKDSEFEKREKELEQSIQELNEKSTDEEKVAVQEEVEKFEKEKEDHDAKKLDLEKEIEQIEKDIAEKEKNQPTDDLENKGTEPSVEPVEKVKEERSFRSLLGGNKEMNIRTRLNTMNAHERSAFFNEEANKFLENVRTCIREKRSLENAGLTIPTVWLPTLKQVISENSKLLRFVNLKQVSGKSRQNIMGDFPEAVWTEMCAQLNEMTLKFNDVEVDGYKLGGFMAICNATLEDSDENLAADIIEAIGKAIGKALDKAIVYGHGKKMPIGFVTRLAQTTKPSTYSDTSREWENLSAKNVKKIENKTGIELFKEIARSVGLTRNKYTSSRNVWIMNEKTHMDLVVEAMNVNLNAVITSSVTNTMPVVGGEIVELEFMADGDIAFGHLDLYLLAQRAGNKLEQSTECRFLQDQTVFKGTSRYDGTPVIAEAFGLLNIAGVEPQTSTTFSFDYANDATLEDVVLGDVELDFNSDTYTYTATSKKAEQKFDAIPSQNGAKIEVMLNDKKAVNGQNMKLNEGANNIEVKVQQGLSTATYTFNVTYTKAAQELI